MTPEATPDGREVRKWKGSTRVPGIDPDVWSKLYTIKDRGRITEEYERYLQGARLNAAANDLPVDLVTAAPACLASKNASNEGKACTLLNITDLLDGKGTAVDFDKPVIVTLTGRLAFPATGGPNMMTYNNKSQTLGKGREHKVVKRLEELNKRASQAGHSVTYEAEKLTP